MDNQLINTSENESEHLLRKKMENNENLEESGKLFSIYKSLIEPLSDFEAMEFNINCIDSEIYGLEHKSHWIRNILLLFGVYMIGMGAVWTVVGGTQGLGFLFSGIIYTAVIILISRWRKGKRQEKINDLQKDRAQVDAERNAKLKEIAPLIKYCPPAYRTSEALTYFVDSYINSRVSTLKEAVKEYDALNRHEEICSSLQNIEFALSRIDSKL